MGCLYAQLDDNNICSGISNLSSEVFAQNMILISEQEYSSELLGKKHENGIWSAEKHDEVDK